jgi:rod shape-determining protein MreB
MIVDIGGGEIAVIALGGIVCDKSVKIAGDVFTNDIVHAYPTQSICGRVQLKKKK